MTRFAPAMITKNPTVITVTNGNAGVSTRRRHRKRHRLPCRAERTDDITALERPTDLIAACAIELPLDLVGARPPWRIRRRAARCRPSAYRRARCRRPGRRCW